MDHFLLPCFTASLIFTEKPNNLNKVVVLYQMSLKAGKKIVLHNLLVLI